jgi:predicted MPP superfamily phosphohydrolase
MKRLDPLVVQKVCGWRIGTMSAHANSEQIRAVGDLATQWVDRNERRGGSRARGTSFLIIVLLVFGLLLAYLVHGLAGPIQLTWVRMLISGLVGAGILATLSVPLLSRRRDSDRLGGLQRTILWVAGAGMGILSFALVFLLARDLASLVVPASLHTEQVSLLILAVSTALFLLGFVGAQFGVKLRRVAVPIENLPSELSGLRILQISDLHVGPTIRKGFVEKLVKMGSAAAPDLVVFTGDFADGKVRELAEEVAPLAALSAPLGKYYVPGNHEYYWGGAAWIEKARELGFAPLINAHEVVRKGGRALAIAGVPDPTAEGFGFTGPDLGLALAGIPQDAYPRIFLCHQPILTAEAERRGVTLQLSGHTHGGQFFPWTLVASWVHRFNAGLHRLGALWIYVSRGTGYWGPPVRVGSPAELTLLVLESSSSR